MKYIKIVWPEVKQQRIILLINFAVTCILSFSGAFALYAQALFIDEAAKMIGMGVEAEALFYPTFLLLLSLMLPLSETVSDYLHMKLKYAFDLSWNKKISDIVTEIPYSLYEEEEIYDKLKQVRDNNLYEKTITCVFSLLTIIINFISYAYVLVRISPWLAISVLIAAPFVGYASSKVADQQYKKSYKLNPDRRRSIYKSSILRSRAYAKDIRVNGCADYMLSDWLDSQKNTDAKTLRVKFKYGFLSALILKTEYVVIFINLLIVLSAYLKGNITVGVFVSTSNQIFSMRLVSKIQQGISQITTTKSVNKSYEEILDLAPKDKQTGLQEKGVGTVEFRNVTFKYPNADNYVLDNVSFKIFHGERIAIVGENGAGKSTLIKILLGLYTPDNGKVLINGRNVNSLSLAEKEKIFGVAFQDYAKFNLTLEENLTLDENEKGTVQGKYFGIEDIAHSLKQGYSTLLGKAFGEAVDLSGGQWQSIAIARALAGDKKIRIFDEPTASLDPVNEVKTFEEISELTKECISIFITHRLGFTTKVDRILLVKNGKVCEDGSFADLMNLDGEFKKMFDCQRKLYIREEY